MAKSEYDIQLSVKCSTWLAASSERTVAMIIFFQVFMLLNYLLGMPLFWIPWIFNYYEYYF